MFTKPRFMSPGFVMCMWWPSFLVCEMQTTVLVPTAHCLLILKPLSTSNFHSCRYYYRLGYKQLTTKHPNFRPTRNFWQQRKPYLHHPCGTLSMQNKADWKMPSTPIRNHNTVQYGKRSFFADPWGPAELQCLSVRYKRRVGGSEGYL